MNISESQVQDLADLILVSASESDVGLWWIAADIEEKLGVHESEEVRRIGIRLLNILIGGGLLQPFCYNDDGSFHDWNETPSAMVDRIAREWGALRRRPEHNEIVSFTATPAGRRAISERGLSTKFRGVDA